MKTYKLLVLVIIALSAFSCAKDDNDDPDRIIISGQFQKIVQGINIWVETIDGITAEDNRYVMFVPDNQEITEESMYADPDADGKFKVTLLKGESYHVLIQYKSSPAIEGGIKFNFSMGNKIIVPKDAPNRFDLGLLYPTVLGTYGSIVSDESGSLGNKYVAQNPLPWLSEIINTSNNTNPVISDVALKNKTLDQPESTFGYKRITYTASATDADGDKVYYNWFLNTSDNSASFGNDYLSIRTLSNEARIFLKSEDSHGTVTLLVTDTRGGSTKRDISF